MSVRTIRGREVTWLWPSSEFCGPDDIGKRSSLAEERGRLCCESVSPFQR